MTNFEKIKNMSVEEMAKFMFFVVDNHCENICKSKRCDAFEKTCTKGIKRWLNSEVEE